MINPDDVTNYNRTKSEKEEFLFFCICVAGKNAHVQARKLEDFLNLLRIELGNNTLSPFELVKEILDGYGPEYGAKIIQEKLYLIRMGQYSRITNLFINLAYMDVESITLEELESLHGIGPKTARFYLTHTQEGTQFAVLDTHILKELASRGYTVPKSTPTGKKYYEIEKIVLGIVEKEGKTTSEWDLETWKKWRKDPYIIQ